METEYLIQQALTELMAGRTTFVIAQRLRTLKQADTILVLEDGRIVQRGTHDELVAQPGLYRRIYDLQLRDQEDFWLDATRQRTPTVRSITLPHAGCPRYRRHEGRINAASGDRGPGHQVPLKKRNGTGKPTTPASCAACGRLWPHIPAGCSWPRPVCSGSR